MAAKFDKQAFYRVVLGESGKFGDTFLPAGTVMTVRGDVAAENADKIVEHEKLDIPAAEEAPPSE